MSGYSDGTRSVHAGLPAPEPGQPFLPGPVFAAPYHLHPETGPTENGYGRPDNPTRRALEAAIGELEGGSVRVFASGQAAITALLFATLRSGDTVAVPTAGPYPSFEGVRLVLLESPANPGLDVCDIPALAAAAHAAGAIVACDNTTATPLGQRPLELGADLVVASGTKALTGHSDVLLGYVATNDPALLAKVVTWRDQTGGIPSAFDSWLAHRSIATLDLRLARQTENAAAVARLLLARGDVIGVRWPGLPGDPSYQVASVQMRRIPGVLSFDLGSAGRVARFLAASELVFAATSFGGVHTTADRRAQWGDDTSEGFVRFSCGIEDTVDLLADVTAALDAA